MDSRSSKILKYSWMIRRGYERSMEETLCKHKLSRHEGNVLLFLSNNELNTAHFISQYSAISKALISLSITSLQEKNFLDIREDDEDKRINRLYIRKEAENAVVDLNIAQQSYYDLLEKGICIHELEHMEDILAKLINNVYKEINPKFW